MTSPDPELIRLVARTRDHRGVRGSREDSLAHAWSEWQAGDREAVSEWASLAYLQGEHDAEAIVEILDALASERPIVGTVPTIDLPDPWRGALRNALASARDRQL